MLWYAKHWRVYISFIRIGAIAFCMGEWQRRRYGHCVPFVVGRYDARLSASASVCHSWIHVKLGLLLCITKIKVIDSLFCARAGCLFSTEWHCRCIMLAHRLFVVHFVWRPYGWPSAGMQYISFVCVPFFFLLPFLIYFFVVVVVFGQCLHTMRFETTKLWMKCSVAVCEASHTFNLWRGKDMLTRKKNTGSNSIRWHSPRFFCRCVYFFRSARRLTLCCSFWMKWKFRNSDRFSCWTFGEMA